MNYNNYHKHDHYGNPWSLDVVVKPEDYCKRAAELGHTSVFTTNHGVTGNIFDWIDCSKKYGLKLIYGTEAYYVDNRFEKDSSNRHIIIIAKNNNGAMQLNDIMSEAHSTGFYKRPRIDKELLFSLNPHDCIITSACVAGLWNNRELLIELHNYFGYNFFLELQNHNMDIQKQVNEEMLKLSSLAKIPIIHANDSHYIYPQESKYREIFLKGKERNYPEEEGMILDYPDSDTIIERYKTQGILSPSQIYEALENTLIFDECEELTYINDDIKLPSVSENPTKELKDIINSRWLEERNTIPREKWHDYLQAIKYEVDIVEKTHMENYFLIDYYIAKNGQAQYGGKLTNTGRGSAPSFYITKMLGLTDIDRVSAPITLFPTRFMSVERILGAKSLPDIDLNTADREPFIKATEDLLGAENCAWMLAWKPLQEASAFRVYCKGIGMDISEYDDVAKNLDVYKDIPKWQSIIEESKKFIGVIESVSESPCSMLLYNKPVRKELGLVHTKTRMCCLLDGYNCDKFKYLKNDYLTVTVWAIIRDVCNLAGIPIPSIQEMDKLLDDKTFDIYKNGLTSTINQADSAFATGMVKVYKPQSVSEMSAFVAIIRPGCASLLQDFVNRKEYSTGVKELDEILVEGNHRMIYQELIMKYLIWLGIPETGSYDIIKKIAKKKFKEAELAELKEKLLKGWIEKVGTENGFVETWTVVEQAAHYSFNASHSLSYAYDSLYGAYLKSHYPLEYYTVTLNYYNDDNERTLNLTNELQYFGITLKPIRFRYSKSSYTLSKEDNGIYKGVGSIKGIGSAVADEIYKFKDNEYSCFFELLFDLKSCPSVKKNCIEMLIKLDFFAEFGDINKLLAEFTLFQKMYGKSQIMKATLQELQLPQSCILPYAEKETAKMFVGIDVKQFLIAASSFIEYKPCSLSDRIKSQSKYLGYIDIKDERCSGIAVVLEIDTKYTPRFIMYSLKNGKNVPCKIDKKTYGSNKLNVGDIISIDGQKAKPKYKRTPEGKYEVVDGTKEYWITSYHKVSL